MKKPILLLALALLSVVALRADFVLSTAGMSGGITTTITVGRVQGDPAADGSLVLTVIPRKVVTLSDGTVVTDQFAASSEWLQVTLDADTLAKLHTAFLAAKTASDAAKAAASAAAAAAK